MLVERLRRIGQDHIARLLDEGSSSVLAQRVEQDLDEVDMGLVNELMQGKHIYQGPEISSIEPAEVVPASFSETKEASGYRSHGEDLLRGGKVAALIVAGGQGSRLGIDAPKGVVGVSPVMAKSLFRIHAEKILALSLRYSRSITLFIMTSRENDAETRQYFQKHSFFGLSPDNVFFFVQGMLPSLTPEGKLIVSREKGLFLNPDGHGGTLAALKKNGCLDVMKKRGIDEIFYFQVDNPLVSVCDPLFVGLHSEKGAQMSSKVVRKRGFEEKVGVIAKSDGKTRVIEYSDMSDAMRFAKDARGEMLFWPGNSAIHLIRRDFAESLTGGDLRLPFHRANKSIPTCDFRGNPFDIQGIKFETFIFDALPLAERTLTMEVIREHEFAPVKNMTGEDSLESSRMMQSNLHKGWLREAGVEVEEKALVEISPLSALEKTDLRQHLERLPGKIVKDTYIG